MSNLSGFIEGLSKERLLCFFLLLWGISWVIGDISSISYYLFSTYVDLLDRVLGLLGALLGLLAGLALTFLGLKLLNLNK